MKKAAEDQAKQIRADANLSKDQRDTALRAVREETERSIRGVFGEKGYTSYERNNGTWWLNSISRDPATQPTPTKKP